MAEWPQWWFAPLRHQQPWSIASPQEILHTVLQVVKLEPKPKQQAPVALPLASTWAEVTKRSLGLSGASAAAATATSASTVQEAAPSEARAAWSPTTATSFMEDEDLMEDDEEDDYDDDAYIEEKPEEAGPHVASATKRRKLERWGRAGKTTARMESLESEMSTVREQLGTILNTLAALSKPPPTPVAPPTLPGKGCIPLGGVAGVSERSAESSWRWELPLACTRSLERE